MRAGIALRSRLSSVWLQVKVEYDDRVKISEICSELDVDGLRGDMVRRCCRTAVGAAAAIIKLTVPMLQC